MKALLLLTLLAVPALAVEPKVVMVLYFDNNTSDREYDVLQKGLADMLISDLAGVDGLKVVEREKLQALLGELKLQRTSYFDPKTASKIGKGVGARYAITGSITELSPAMRLDVRLIDISSQKVEKAEQVVGTKEQFFELEQQLVKKFVASLGLKLPDESRAGEADLDSALSYSKALDFTDRGDLKSASDAMSKAVEDAPDFTLAKERYAEILKRLRQAGQKRQTELGADEKALVENITASFKRGLTPPLKTYEVESYFCHRGLNASYLAWKVSNLLPPADDEKQAQVIAKDTRAEALALMKQYFENTEAMVNDSISQVSYFQYQNYSVECPMTLYQLKSKSFQLLKFSLHIPFYGHVRTHPIDLVEALTRFVFVGTLHVEGGPGEPDEGTTWRFTRPLYALDPSYGQKMLALIDLAEKQFDPKDNVYPGPEARESSIAVSRAVALSAMHQPQKAIAAIEGFLEKYPRSKHYKDYERVVEDLLGASAEAQAAQKAIKGCKVAALDKTIETEVSRVADASGARGLHQLLTQLHKCDGPAAKEVLRKAQIEAARQAALVGDCAMVKAIEAMAPTRYGPACE